MVRDDAQRLDRCLASVKGHVDAICVLDTGSKDNSVEVARKHGAKVHEIEWPNNFGEALNVLLAMVETPWTVRLDSDEWFESGQASQLRRATEMREASGFYMIRRDLGVEGNFAEIEVMRLWRTHPDIQYVGAVHENIPHASIEKAFPGKKILRTPLFFWHDGYTTDVKGKAMRNIQLLKGELEKHPEKIEIRAMIATTYKGTGEPEGPEYLEEFIDHFLSVDLDNPLPQVALALAMYMDSMPEWRVQEDRTGELIRRAVKLYPKNPAILYFAGILERRRGNMEAALKRFLKLEALVEMGDYDRSMSIPQEFVGDRLWNALGYVSTQLGRQDVADRAGRRLAMAKQSRPRPS